MEIKTEKLKQSHKRAIDRIIKEVLITWSMPENASKILPLWLAAPYPFYNNIFSRKLADEVNRDKNSNRLNSDAIELELLLQVMYCLY